MKTKNLLSLFAGLVLAGGLLYSCSKENNTTAPVKEQGNLKSSTDCSVCVPNWIDSKQTYSGFLKITGKTSTPSTDLFLDVYNDDAKVYYKVYRTAGTFGNIDINNAGVIGFDPAVSEYAWSVDLPVGWKACDPKTVDLVVAGVSGGGKYTGTYNYNLRERCLVETCDESFSYSDIGNKTYTFTYIPSEDLTDVNVVFTFAQGTSVTGLDGWENNGVTYQKRLSFTHCKTVVWTVGLQANCSGNSHQSNVWTDFTIGGVSKKGALANIIQTCN